MLLTLATLITLATLVTLVSCIRFAVTRAAGHGLKRRKLEGLTRKIVNNSLVLACSSLTLAGSIASADTFVRIDTDAGSFAIELFEEAAPITVENFLGYVDSGAYDGTLVHRSVDNFVIQGGGYAYLPQQGSFAEVTTGPTITNEFNLSNQRGTVAMAKIGGDPNSATSQWFINVQDNLNLDTAEEGYAVFGRVLGAGMGVVDAINDLQTVSVNGFSALSSAPVLGVNGNTIADVDWVDLSMRSISDSAEFENGVISVALDAGELGRALVDFRITSDSPATVITLDPTTVLFIGASMDEMATFNSISGEFFIPTLTVPGGSGYKNLRFQLSDADSYSFTLQSFEQP